VPDPCKLLAELRFWAQTPLKELVVYHPDATYLSDVDSLGTYVKEELNVREVTFTSDEAECGVKWRADAEWSVLGKKLRSDLSKVKKALPELSSEDVRRYLAEGKITVAGIDLVQGDLIAVRYVDTPNRANHDDDAEYISHTDNDVVILLDKHVRPEFEDEALARELINRVQKARKEAGCTATEQIDVYLRGVEEQSTEGLKKLVYGQGAVIKRVLKDLPKDDSERDTQRPVLYDSEEGDPAEVGGWRFWLVLVRGEQ
jgi:isoleucyl-tRNA synthetase